MQELLRQRQFMKSEAAKWKEIISNQKKRLPQPPLVKEYDIKSKVIELPKVNKKVIKKTNVFEVLMDRKSSRSYSKEAISIEELAYLLWMTQGVRSVTPHQYSTKRTVPSAGERHAFETYLLINRVEKLKRGVYRYLPLEHKLLLVFEEKNIQEEITKRVLDQCFVGKAAAAFAWACIPYRGEWRYSILAHKNMLLDAGHICQNLYIASESLKLGTCAIGAYDQEKMDKFLGLDGIEEFTVYMAAVGKIEQR